MFRPVHLALIIALAIFALSLVACDANKGGDAASSKPPKSEKAAAKKTAPARKGDVVVTLSEADKGYLIGVARKAFETWVLEKKPYTPADVPDHLAKMKVNRVFATIYKQGEWRGCVSADKGEIIPTVVHAVINTAKDSRFKDPSPEELAVFRVELSFLQPFEAVHSKDPKEIETQIEPGVHGISIEHASGRKAFFLPYVFVKKQRTTTVWLERICQKAGLPKDAWKSPEATIYRYDTVNFIEETPNGKAVDLYRYKVELDSLSADALPKAIDLTAKWLIRQQDPSTGKFAPGHDTDIKPLRKDSATSQLLAVASLGQAETTRTFGSDMAKIYERFMGSFKTQVVYSDQGTKVDSPDAPSLEATLALAEVVTNAAKFPERAKLAKGLAQHLRTVLDPGAPPTAGENIPDLKTYAVWIMARLAAVTADAADKERARALYDAWWGHGTPFSLAALAALVALIPDDALYARMLSELTEIQRRRFTTESARFNDYVGAFDVEKGPTAVGVAAVLRGLGVAYPLIKSGDGQYAADILTAAMFASRWLLEQQFTETSAFYIHGYQEILGSFKRNVVLNTSSLGDTAFPLMALAEVQHAMGPALADAFQKRAAELNK